MTRAYSLRTSLFIRLATLFTLALACPTPAQASQIWLASPREGRLTEFRRWAQNPVVKKQVVSPVFSPSEQSALRSLGNPTLAEALRLRLSGFPHELKKTAASAFVDLEPAEYPITLAETLPWGLRNLDQPGRIDLSDLSSLWVTGRSGEDIGWFRAPPEAATTARRVRVAVLDSGVDTSHPDLRTQVVRTESECEQLRLYQECRKTSPQPASCDTTFAKIDTDGNGYPLDCSGWSLSQPSPNRITGIWGDPFPTDDAGHGTHVAGIIGARPGPQGTRGVMTGVEILPVKVIQQSPLNPARPQSVGLPTDTDPQAPGPEPREATLKWSAGFTDIVARGLLYAIRSRAQVANFSMAWPPNVDSPFMRQMIALAQAQGMLIVASAGNDSNDSRVFPCQYPGVICVAAHGPDGALSHFSSFGSFVDVAAPGLNILSTWPMAKKQTQFLGQPGYEFKNGTSMAAPYVTGIITRLLSEGFSPRDAYARLLLGTRPIAEAQFPTPTQPRKWVRTGNVDLALALEVTPQPLILAAEKSIIKLRWDGEATRLPLRVRLKNFWKAAPTVEIRATLQADHEGPSFAQLDIDSWTQTQWEENEERELETALLVQDHQLEGRLKLIFEVGARRFSVPIEISTWPQTQVETLPLQTPVMTPLAPGSAPSGAGAVLSSVQAIDARATQDYVVLGSAGTQQPLLTLLIEEPVAETLEKKGSPYYRVQPVPAFQLPAPGAELLQSQRLDIDQDGRSDYVLLFREPARPGTPPRFHFIYVQPDGAVYFKQSYDNVISAMGDGFQWLAVAPPPARLVPAWIARGLLPPLEKPAFDPWRDPNRRRSTESDLAQEIDTRLYYLSPEGVRSLTTAEATPVDWIALPTELKARGQARVLLSRGNDYAQIYELAEIKLGQLKSSATLPTQPFRFFLGATERVRLISLETQARASGTAFASASAGGSLRSTAITAEGKIFDWTQRPIDRLSALLRPLGVFFSAAGTSVQGVWSQSIYDLVYTELESQAQAPVSLRTSQDRFSFLPGVISRRNFFPIVAESSPGEREPALLIPAGLGATDAVEVIIPLRDSRNRPVALSRPARLRLETPAGCRPIANPVPESATKPAQLAFYCGDRILRVPTRVRSERHE